MTRFILRDAVRLPLLALALAMAACSEPVLVTRELDSPAGSRTAGDVALAGEPGTNALLLAWVSDIGSDRHIEISRSTDDGATWSPTVRVTRQASDVGPPHGEAAPRIIAAGDGRVAIVWSKAVPVPGRRWPASAIRFARSLDGGTTWSSPLTLNDDSTGSPGTHTFHGAAWIADSGIVAAWLDERGAEGFDGHHHAVGEPAAEESAEADARIFMTVSHDFGGTWEPNRQVWGAVCPCCRVTLARDGDRGVVSAWRQHLPGNIRDVVTVPLLPEPGTPRRVHADNWEYPGCPHTGPALAVGADGSRHVAWYTGKPGGAGVYYARVDSNGAAEGDVVALVTAPTVQTAHASAIPLDGGGALVAMDVDEDGSRAIRLTRIDRAGAIVSSATIEGSAGGTYPQLALGASGNALVAWTAPTRESSTVRIARVSVAR